MTLWEPSPEVAAAGARVAAMSVDEFATACRRVGIRVAWPASACPWPLRDEDTEYWALYDEGGERVAEA